MVMILSLFLSALLAAPVISFDFPITEKPFPAKFTLMVNMVTRINVAGPIDLFSAVITPLMSFGVRELAERRVAVKLISDGETLEVGYNVDENGIFKPFCNVKSDSIVTHIKLLDVSPTKLVASLRSSNLAIAYIYVSFSDVTSSRTMKVELNLITQYYDKTKASNPIHEIEAHFEWERTKAVRNANMELQVSAITKQIFWVNEVTIKPVELSTFELKYVGDGEVAMLSNWSFSGSISPSLPSNVSLPLFARFQPRDYNTRNFLDYVSK